MRKLSFIQRTVLRLRGRVLVSHGELPVYVFRCPMHGLVEASPSGHGNTLLCPGCIKENLIS